MLGKISDGFTDEEIVKILEDAGYRIITKKVRKKVTNYKTSYEYEATELYVDSDYEDNNGPIREVFERKLKQAIASFFKK